MHNARGALPEALRYVLNGWRADWPDSIIDWSAPPNDVVRIIGLRQYWTVWAGRIWH